mgnify:CR=1 FL=1
MGLARGIERRLERLVDKLPEEQRMALVLFEFHGMSQDEIARAMDCPTATVKTRLHRAKKFLRETLSSPPGERS